MPTAPFKEFCERDFSRSNISLYKIGLKSKIGRFEGSFTQFGKKIIYEMNTNQNRKKN